MNNREKIDILTTNIGEKAYLQPKYINNAVRLFNYKIPILNSCTSNLWERRVFIKIHGKIYRYYAEKCKTIKVLTSSLHPNCIYSVWYFYEPDYMSGYGIKCPHAVFKHTLPAVISDIGMYYTDTGNNNLRKICELIFNQYSNQNIDTFCLDDNTVNVKCNFTVSIKDMVESTAVYVRDTETFTDDILCNFDEYNDNLDVDEDGTILYTNERYISEYMIRNELLFKNNIFDHKCTVSSIINDNKSYTSNMMEVFK